MPLQTVLQSGINHPYVYAKNNPIIGTDPTGEIGAVGVTAYNLYFFYDCVSKCPVDCEDGDTRANIQCKRDCVYEYVGPKAKKGPGTGP